MDDEELDNVIVLNDEDGNEVNFEFLDLVELDGEEYVILLPSEEVNDEEAGEVVILKIEDTESEEVQRYIRENLSKDNVKKFINEYIENVSIGIENIIRIFEPEAICFGGSFAYYTDILLPMIEEKINIDINRKVKLLQAELKNDAGIIGATEI